MKAYRLLVFLLALAAAAISCEKRPQSDSGADDAKVRPEVAVARKGASPSPVLGDGSATPAPSPTPPR